MMKDADSVAAARRAALKALVPQAHFLAAGYASSDAVLAEQLRAFGDRMDEVATYGSPAMLSAFFGLGR